MYKCSVLLNLLYFLGSFYSGFRGYITRLFFCIYCCKYIVVAPMYAYVTMTIKTILFYSSPPTSYNIIYIFSTLS